MVKKLFYITRARVPSEKAHSYQIVKMCEAYAEIGYSVTLIVPKRVNSITLSAFAYFAIVENFVIKYISVPPMITNMPVVGRILYWLEGLYVLGALLFVRIDKTSLIITRSPEIAFFYKIRSRNVILEVHDWPKTQSYLYSKLLCFVGQVVTTSNGLAQKCLAAGVQNVCIASNGVDEKFFKPYTPLTRRELGIESTLPIVMYIGALSSWKGVDSLYELSTKNEKNYQIIIAGGNPEQIVELKEQYPNIIFLGSTPTQDLMRYQALANILVVPNSTTDIVSTTYTSPIKLFAHMASRIPIIVTDIPSVREIVSELEVYFFDGTVESLGQVIKKVLNLTSDEIRQKTNAAFNLLQDYTWSKRAIRITYFFEKK